MTEKEKKEKKKKRESELEKMIFSIMEKSMKTALDKALDDMPEDSLLKPFLIANKAEVKRMCITEYDEARTLSETMEEGLEKAVQNGRDAGLSNEEIIAALKKFLEE